MTSKKNILLLVLLSTSSIAIGKLPEAKRAEQPTSPESDQATTRTITFNVPVVLEPVAPAQNQNGVGETPAQEPASQAAPSEPAAQPVQPPVAQEPAPQQQASLAPSGQSPVNVDAPVAPQEPARQATVIDVTSSVPSAEKENKSVAPKLQEHLDNLDQVSSKPADIRAYVAMAGAWMSTKAEEVFGRDRIEQAAKSLHEQADNNGEPLPGEQSQKTAADAGNNLLAAAQNAVDKKKDDEDKENNTTTKTDANATQESKSASPSEPNQVSDGKPANDPLSGASAGSGSTNPANGDGGAAKGKPSDSTTREENKEGFFASVGTYCGSAFGGASAAITAHPLAFTGGTVALVAAAWVLYKFKYASHRKKDRSKTLDEELAALEHTLN